MTGAMLRSIRKAYRLDVAQIANAAGLAVQTVRMTELTGKSYACGRQDRDARRRAQVWRAYLKALRVLRVGRKPVIQAAPKPAWWSSTPTAESMALCGAMATGTAPRGSRSAFWGARSRHVLPRAMRRTRMPCWRGGAMAIEVRHG